MARLDISTLGQTIDVDVTQYSLVYLDWSVWRLATEGITPEGIYEGFNIVVTSDSDTVVPALVVEFVFSPTGSGFETGIAEFGNDGTPNPVTIDLVGSMATQSRLYTYSGTPYGRVYLNTVLSNPRYLTTSSQTIREYDSSTGVIMAEGDTYVIWYDGDTFISRYTIDRDPAPYWSNGMAYPAELDIIATRLPMEIIKMLIGTTPVYTHTGPLRIHAALTLYEYATLFDLLGSLPTLSGSLPLSWRSKNVRSIASQEIHLRNPEYISLYRNASDVRTITKLFIMDIIKTLYPRGV